MVNNPVSVGETRCSNPRYIPHESTHQTWKPGGAHGQRGVRSGVSRNLLRLDNSFLGPDHQRHWPTTALESTGTYAGFFLRK